MLLKLNPVEKLEGNTATKFFRIFDSPYVLSEKVGNTFGKGRKEHIHEVRKKTLRKYYSTSFRKYYVKDE